MPDYQSFIKDGVTVVDWLDSVADGNPSRLNSPRYPHRYHRVDPPLPRTVVVQSLVGGLLTNDAGLDGRLFFYGWDQYGNGAPPPIIPTPGTTAEVTFTFQPSNTGLWILRVMRDQSGCTSVPMLVEQVV